MAAASAIGLAISWDAGTSWAIEHEGLHANYCSAVAFAGDDIFVAASGDHFAAQGAVYRKPVIGRNPLLPVGADFPRWIDGIADTGCIAANGPTMAVADRAGHLYVSTNHGLAWSRWHDSLPAPSSVLIA